MIFFKYTLYSSLLDVFCSVVSSFLFLSASAGESTDAKFIIVSSRTRLELVFFSRVVIVQRDRSFDYLKSVILELY